VAYSDILFWDLHQIHINNHAVVGMNLLFEETLIELELLLFEERYTESSYIEKAEKCSPQRRKGKQ
jgi:hypothetical protein